MEQFDVGDVVYIEHKTWGPATWSGPHTIARKMKRPRVLVLDNGDKFDHGGFDAGKYSTRASLHHATDAVKARAHAENTVVRFARLCAAVRDGSVVIRKDATDDILKAIAAIKLVTEKTS